MMPADVVFHAVINDQYTNDQQPPNPIADTRSPVLPRVRYGISEVDMLSSFLLSDAESSIGRRVRPTIKMSCSAMGASHAFADRIAVLTRGVGSIRSIIRFSHRLAENFTRCSLIPDAKTRVDNLGGKVEQIPQMAG